MREIPILMNGAMVRATLADLKTQTRRLVKSPPWSNTADHMITLVGDGVPRIPVYDEWQDIPCPYGQPGDRLWVKETFYAFGRWETRFNAKKGRDEWHFIDMTLETGHAYLYAADNPRPQPLGGRRAGGVTPKWWKRPAIFMTRVASRILLEITSRRAERLQEITEADAISEGIERHGEGWQRYHVDPDAAVGQPFTRSPVLAFRGLWEHINGPGSWNPNPVVWVIEFTRVKC